jgi:P27 family predicted phage terminase small subunit
MAGRRPKPTALKQLAGNPGKRAVNHCEPQPSGIPDCPEHLDAEAKTEWQRISAELLTLGLLTSVDRAALAAYCASWSRWIAAEKNIAKFGAVIKAPSGYPIQSPFVSISNSALDLLRKFLIEFGLSPASRSRLSINPTPPADSFEAFMAGIGADDITEPEETQTEPL